MSATIIDDLYMSGIAAEHQSYHMLTRYYINGRQIQITGIAIKSNS